MKLYYRFFLYPLAALLILMQSCIGEDNSDCANNVRVYFSYRTTYAQWLIDPAEVSRVNLLVFDEKGRFVGEWTDRNPKMSLSYYMDIPLAYGSYRFICWAGMEECYSVTPSPLVPKETFYTDCILKLNKTNQNTVEEMPNHLFHGMLKEGVVDKPESRFTIELKQLTNTINLITEGIENPTDDFQLTIDDDNGNYNFEASLVNIEELKYKTSCMKSGQGQPSASLRMMALDESRPNPILKLTNTTRNTEVYSANLVELILQLRDRGRTVDFNNIHTYDIVLRFNAGTDSDSDVDVAINGWDLNASQAEI